MKRLLLIALAVACGQAAAARDPEIPRSAAASPGAFVVLCYHEVRSGVRDYPDPFAVDDGALVAQFAWLRGNGYTPVSLDQIVAARLGGKPLPAKAVLLSFDDGYLSFYTRVYPLLREFGYPAVLAVVGAWIDGPAAGTQYGEKGTVPDASFPTWAQLREMAGSGLVEVASHTYDLHRGVPANPQGNVEPAATTRIYDAATRTYESDSAWRARVRADLARNADAIERGAGRRPRAIVWPYGSYNDELVRIAKDLGSPVALTLGDGANTAAVPLDAVRRILIGHNPNLADFAAEVRGPQFPEPLRALEVALDDLYSPDAAVQEAKLSALLDRVEILRPTHVYLWAYAGAGEAVYFPNGTLPMRADLFNRVAWQLATRDDVKVFARLPPESAAALYEDLARTSAFDGLLVEDGAATEGVSAFRAPMGIARVSGARIEHAPPYPGDERKVVIMLNAADGGDALAREMRALQLGGAIHFGYAPDDPGRDNPRLAKTARAMSLRAFPAATRSGGAQ
jgi:biofilm PGA synthesis lipoprotein PgaB